MAAAGIAVDGHPEGVTVADVNALEIAAAQLEHSLRELEPKQRTALEVAATRILHQH